jgi:hypothetical protein
MPARERWIRSTRYDMAVDVSYRPVVGGPWIPGRTRIVSRTGMLFETLGLPLAVDTEVDAILTLDEVNPARLLRVQSRGKVVRVIRGERAGLVVMATTIEEYRFLPHDASPADPALVWPGSEEDQTRGSQ